MAYLAEISGGSWAEGPEAELGTVAECRRWAESFGDTADRCTVRDLSRWSPRADHPDRERPVVAVHQRDASGDGRRWRRGAVPRPRIDDGRTVDRDPLRGAGWRA